MLIQYLIVLLLFVIVKAENGTENSNLYFTDLNNNTIYDLQSYCTPEKPCVRKCCDKNKMLSMEDGSCIDIPETIGYLDMNFTELPIYRRHLDNIDNMIKLNKTVTEAFKVIVAHNYGGLYSTYDYYVTDDGLAMEFNPNKYRNWIAYNFCMDYIYEYDNYTEKYYFNVFLVQDVAYVLPEYDYRFYYNGIGRLVSCFFMLITLTVYGLLPELQNLNGLVFIATIFTMFCSFLSLDINVFIPYETLIQCFITGIVTCFFLMSTFFWMAVNSYDKFKIFFRRLPIRLSPNDKWEQFAYYCLFAWGTPLLLTIFILIIDKVDLTKYPKFVKPGLASDDCVHFFNNNINQDFGMILFLYTPIAIVICFNTLFCAITGFYIWKDSYVAKNEGCYSTKTKPHQLLFWVYLKLSTLTGISWIFEIAINYMPSNYEWFKYIVDTYNNLFGIIIFFMFIFKKRIFNLLRKKVAGWMQ